jgi:uroporphyrinogen decarboxylase
MPELNRRELFDSAMNHQPVLRVPLDIGGTSLTGMRRSCQQRLLSVLGYSEQTDSENNGVDERILRWANTDFRSVGAIIRLPSVHKRTISDVATVDSWGIHREIINGERQITRSPLKGASIDDLKSFQWPEARIDEAQLVDWQQSAKTLKEQNEYVVIAQHPVYGILELGCWMCGYDDFLLKLALDADFIRYFFDKIFALQTRIIDQYYTALGPYIDVTTSGDDFGTQGGPLISPDMFDTLIAPYFSERITRTKHIAKCYFWHHSCGSIYRLLPSIIACGVDILNPIQTSAAEMDPAGLKDAFGDEILFWGAVDVQKFLPGASTDEVREHIGYLIDTLGSNGGFVMAPAHEMLDDIPPENIVAWIETAKSHVIPNRS